MGFLRNAFIIFVLVSTQSAGQDIHFTQFNAAPLTLNPSLTGDYIGDYRFMNTFRSQWRKFDPGYITNSVGYDQQIYISNEKFSGGVNIVYDQSGINAMQITKINLSFAWHKLVNRNVFHIGFQTGYVMKAFDVSKLSFPDQFNNTTGYFDTELPTLDDDFSKKTNFIDINAGIGWHRKIGRHTPKLGIAVFHINEPDESFLDQKNRLPRRLVFTASDRYELNERSSITPQGMFMENVKANDFIFGATITRKSALEESKIKSINYGAYLRNSIRSKPDAVALVAGFRYNLFDFGFSYDVNISEVKEVTDKRGAFEISIIYTALNTRALKIKIPCDRY
jgi:type IX secretion system PorP/SprF family membrane protein